MDELENALVDYVGLEVREEGLKTGKNENWIIEKLKNYKMGKNYLKYRKRVWKWEKLKNEKSWKIEKLENGEKNWKIGKEFENGENG